MLRVWWDRFAAAPRARWALAGAAAAALIVVLTIPQVRDFVRSGPTAPPDRAESPTLETPAPATLPETAQPDAENTVRYTFRIEAGEAREVCLAGDFNHWRVCEAPLRRVGEDVWSVTLELPPGRYEYMFVVDGQWLTDPKAVNRIDDGFGHQNALLII